MSNEMKVLLARPNSAIVKDMRAALERNGFTPFSVETLEKIKTINRAGLKGVIISTSVVSTIKEPFYETFVVIRNRFPDIPVLFTTQAESDRMAPLVQSALKTVAPETIVHNFSPDLLNPSMLGSKESVVLISKNDLINPDATPWVDGLLKKLFK